MNLSIKTFTSDLPPAALSRVYCMVSEVTSSVVPAVSEDTSKNPRIAHEIAKTQGAKAAMEVTVLVLIDSSSEEVVDNNNNNNATTHIKSTTQTTSSNRE